MGYPDNIPTLDGEIVVYSLLYGLISFLEVVVRTSLVRSKDKRLVGQSTLPPLHPRLPLSFITKIRNGKTPLFTFKRGRTPLHSPLIYRSPISLVRPCSWVQ